MSETHSLPAKGQYDPEHPLSLESYERFFAEVQERATALGCQPTSLVIRNPHKAAHCLWLYAQGVSKQKIAEIVGITRNTVRDLCFDHRDTVDVQRKRMSGIYLQVANEYVNLLYKRAEQLEDDPDMLATISPDKLAVTVGIMTDQHSKLAGLNTLTIEHKKGATIEDAKAYLDEIKKIVANRAAKSEAIEAEIVESND